MAGLAAVPAALKLWDVLEMPPPERRVRRLGEVGPRLLCLHGLFASSAFWIPLGEVLAADHRVVAPDLLGFGASPKPEDARYDVDDHVSWLQPVIEEPGEPWVVVGHSMGTVLAVAAAQRFPELVGAVVLFSAPVYSSPESRRAIFGRQNLLTRASTRSRVLGRVICEASCLLRPVMKRLGPVLRPDVRPELARDDFHHRWHSYDRSFHHLVLERDLLRDMADVRQPILVVQGDADAIVESPDRLRWPPNARVERVPGATHTSLLLDEPRDAAALIRQVTVRETARR